MKSILQQLIAKNKREEMTYGISRQAEIDNLNTGNNRRDFLKKTALGGTGLTGGEKMIENGYAVVPLTTMERAAFT
ncbi:MAG: twin-arginine translocation signal domain-containing protein [Pricia sp.]|nr:twin-arginine translocation signal domain-containing protein [Pricia sp.]